MTLDGQNRKEATQLRLLNSKSATKIGTWNVRSIYIPGKAQTIANEMKAYEIGILGIAEARWNDAGQSKLTSGEMIIYSGHMEENAQHSEGVAIMLSKEAQKTLIGWEPISARIIIAKFKTTNKRISLNIIQCYAPTNGAEDNIKEEFYQLLEETTRKCSSKDIIILMGDLNAKVGSDNTGYEQVMGRHGLGEMNENGELFANHCANHNLVIGGTVFPHKKCHLATWVSPDMNTENQIDHVCISKKFWRSLQDVRVKRGADAATDHHLIVANVKLKLKKHQNIESTGKRFNISMLENKAKKSEFQIELKNRFSIFQNAAEEIISIEDHWQEIKNAFTTACETSVSLKNRKHQEWITPETLVKVEKRKNMSVQGEIRGHL
ncbi:craniofacial development protein 2-like [Mytilus edulis]|uniref:craniofacial development protein 2-like n=1 Tax=Mytilus edulis TaxID=6550 RepID=UPI0039F13C5F